MSAQGSNSTKLEEVKAQLASLMDDARVGTPSMVVIDTELVPILNELIKVWKCNDQHPAIRQLFNWLSNPERSADEFFYVMGPLWMHVWEQNMHTHVPPNFRERRGFNPCMAKVAAEALAINCPVLQGAWEYVAWLVLNVLGDELYSADLYGVSQTHLITWIISVIGNPDLCPNPYLRLELIRMIRYMVNIDNQDKYVVFESVMSACMGLDMGYVIECYRYGKFYTMYLRAIYMSVYNIVGGNEIYDIDKRLAEKVSHLKTSWLSTMFHDASHSYGLDHSMYTEPKEILGLTTLLKITVRYSQLYLKKDHNTVGHLLLGSVMFISFFKRTCQMPQLIDLTASYIMEILDHIVIMFKVGWMDYPDLETDMWHYNLCLKLDYTENNPIVSSPLGQLITHKYCERLSGVRRELKFRHSRLKKFPTIYDIIFKC